MSAGLEYARAMDCERLILCNDRSVGLRAIICIHSTALGPANAGLRMLPYASDGVAIDDAVRLARAMTDKWAAAGENRGGGMAVIVGDPATDKSEALLRRFGQFVDQLGGAFYVGEDSGITLDDMEVIHLGTDDVATLPERAGGVGDIAPATARGAIEALRACAQRTWGTPDLHGAERGVTPCAPEDIHRLDVDVFAPFALGGVINDATVREITARVVAGSANNIFREDRHAEERERRGIVYAPDFVANAGGAIYDTEQFRKGGFNAERVWRNVARIYDRVIEVFALATRERVPVYRAANLLAERRLLALSMLTPR